MMTVKQSLIVLILFLEHCAGFSQSQPSSTVWLPQFDDYGTEIANEGFLISQTELPESVTDLYPKITKLQIISNINYRYAHTAVSSTMFNPDRASQEIHFSMVIPETAFISGFSIEVNEEVYKAYVYQKEQAKKEYEDAVQQGRSAGHVQQLSARDSNRFMVSVNIEPLSYMSFNLTYEELLVRKLSTYSHIINLDPGQIVEDLSVEVNIQESSNITTLHVPPLRISNEISTHPEGISNPLAKVIYQTPESVKIKWAPTVLQQQEVSLNGVRGQLIVQYDTSRTSLPGQLLIHEDYFAHFFAPEDLLPLQKHVIFVLDVSSSMRGQKLMQLKEAMHKILDDLYNEDFFSLVIFSSNAYAWRGSSSKSLNVMEVNAESKLMYPVTKYTIKKAKEVVSQLKADGGTNLYDAIKWALTISAKSKMVRKDINISSENILSETIIILITDGEPTVGVTLQEQIISDTGLWNKECNATIYSLAVGREADFEFLKMLSLRNSGFARRIYEGTDTAIQLTDFYQQVASPFLANVNFKYDNDQVVPDTVTRRHFSSFYSGTEIVVAGQLQIKDSRTNLKYEVTGKSRGGMKHFEDENPVIVLDEILNKQGTVSTEYIGFLERLWAYLSINQLIEQAETADEGQDQLKKHALELALKYSFVTPLTSLVVVRPNGSKALAETQRADFEGFVYTEDRMPDVISYLDKSFASSNRKTSRTDLQLLSSIIMVFTYYMYTVMII